MKYVYWPEWKYEQLFDLVNDPTEKNNLVHDHEYTEELHEDEGKIGRMAPAGEVNYITSPKLKHGALLVGDLN
jgi:hypothetical protein